MSKRKPVKKTRRKIAARLGKEVDVLFFKPNRDRHLIAKASSAESKGVYLKMKGDYYRYLAEGDIGDAKGVVVDDSQKAYQDAFDISKPARQPTHPNRLGQGLNLSVFTSRGDHKPLRPLYNDMTKTAQGRVTRHRNTEQDLHYTDKYLEGRAMPGNHATRHAAPIEGLDEEEQEKPMVNNGKDIQDGRGYNNDLPPAMSRETLREVEARDTVYQELKEAVKKGRKPTDRSRIPYTAVWTEQGVLEGLLCKGEETITPEGWHKDHDVELRDWGRAKGHSTHQWENGTKRQRRLRLWFPRMDKAVERRVRTSRPRQASGDSKARDPLKPTKTPEEPRSSLYADHRGPTQDGRHLLVVIDGFENFKNFENFADGNVTKDEREGTDGTRTKGPAYTNKVEVGLMKGEEVKQRYEEGFKPMQPARYQVPYHYQVRLEAHLTKLEKEGVIEKVNPAEAVVGILNLAISEGEQAGTATGGIETDTRTIGDHELHQDENTTNTKATETNTRTSGDHELHQDENTTKTKATDGIETTETDTRTRTRPRSRPRMGSRPRRPTPGPAATTSSTRTRTRPRPRPRMGSRPIPGPAATTSMAATGGVEDGGGGDQMTTQYNPDM